MYINTLSQSIMALPQSKSPNISQCNSCVFNISDLISKSFSTGRDMTNKTFPLFCVILMFGDFRFVEKRLNLQLARFEYWLSQIDEKLVIIEIGAGKAVPTVRNMSERIRRSFDSTIIRINPFEADGADIEIRKGALEALKEIKKYI